MKLVVPCLKGLMALTEQPWEVLIKMHCHFGTVQSVVTTLETETSFSVYQYIFVTGLRLRSHTMEDANFAFWTPV